MFYQRLRVIAAVCGVVLGLAGCGESSSDNGKNGKAVIVASIYPLADLAQRIVGDSAEVICLLPSGASPHTFEINIKQMEAVGSAKLIVVIGLGVDDWAQRAAGAVGRSDCVFIASKALGIDEHGEHERVNGNDGEHGHGMIDPHIWLDPVLAKGIVEKLSVKLSEMLPTHTGMISDNSKKLIVELEELDKDYRRELGNVKRKEIVTFHGAYGRLAQRYGLKVAAVLKPIESAGEVTMMQLDNVMAAIEKYDLKAVYAEPQFPRDAADLLAKEAGVKVLVLDPLGNPNKKDVAGYVAMMRTNLARLKEGLSTE